MLSILFLLTALVFGDLLSRRFLRFESLMHRLAASFLVGSLVSSCLVYVLALCFSFTGSPLFWANIAFFLVVAGATFAMSKLSTPRTDVFFGVDFNRRPPGNWGLDAMWLTLCVFFGWLLMATMLTYRNGVILFTIGTWSDNGANLSLMQSFALGNNFPTVHPFFPGEIIHYHFMFWFFAANVEYLGLNVVTAINLVSVLSLAALLILLMTFAEKLFNSRAVGRISLIFFFLATTSLSYIPFLWSQNSLSETVAAIIARKAPLASGFAYHGEGWSSLSIISFLAQRQLIAACGILLIVLIFVVDFYRRRGAFPGILKTERVDSQVDTRRDVAAMAFCGFLIGLLPYLNTAVLISAAVIFGTIFLLFPHRKIFLPLLLTALVVGAPQMLLLKSGSVVSMSQTFFNWGYTIQEPTMWKIGSYLLWTFGFKWLVLAIALFFVSGAHRRLLLALSTPLVIAFMFQFSVIPINNHKLLNVWGVLTTGYVAYGIWLIGRKGTVRPILAGVLTVVLVFGAIIDLFPTYNDGYIGTAHPDDQLSKWVMEETKPSDIFLTQMWLSHSILFAGRKIFYGNTLYAWGAGYGGLEERGRIYKQMMTTNDPNEFARLLRENNISYVAVDNGLRLNENTRTLSEDMLKQNFELVFEAPNYDNIKIYRVR